MLKIMNDFYAVWLLGDAFAALPSSQNLRYMINFELKICPNVYVTEQHRTATHTKGTENLL